MTSLGWKFRRLRAMRLSEIVSRIGTQTRLQWDRIVGERRRHRRRTARSSEVGQHSSKPWLQKWPLQLDSREYLERASALQRGQVQLFGQSYELGCMPNWNTDPSSQIQLPERYGPLLSLRNPAQVGSIKHLWELNRHACLTELAQAWRLSGNPNILRTFEDRLGSWLKQCPARRGPNWHSAHEAAMRLINWAISWHVLGLSDSTEERACFENVDFLSLWEASVIEHLLFISEFRSGGSSANNHLFGELVGLFVGALTWNGLAGADQLAKSALNGLEQQSLLQILEDGTGAEQAPWYLHELCDMLGFCILLGAANDKTFSTETLVRLERGLDFLRELLALSDPPFCIGDSDDAIPVPLGGVCLDQAWRAVVQTYSAAGSGEASIERIDKVYWLKNFSEIEGLSAATSARSCESTRSYLDGGYLIASRMIDSRGQTGGKTLGLMLDVGGLGYLSIAAHGHADALSLCMSVDKQPFLIDPGTFSYRPNDSWRDWFRGTSAHNTVSIDDQDQSLITGPFMWSKHARCELLESRQTEESLSWTACHYGYERLLDPVVHTRTIVWDKPWSELRVIDSFQCSSSHQFAWSWQFAPAWNVQLTGTQARLSSANRTVVLTLPSGVQARANSGLTLPVGGWVSRRLFEKTEASRITAVIKGAGSARFTTVFRLLD